MAKWVHLLPGAAQQSSTTDPACGDSTRAVRREGKFCSSKGAGREGRGGRSTTWHVMNGITGKAVQVVDAETAVARKRVAARELENAIADDATTDEHRRFTHCDL